MPVSSFGKAYGSQSQHPHRYRARNSTRIWLEANEVLDESRWSLSIAALSSSSLRSSWTSAIQLGVSRRFRMTTPREANFVGHPVGHVPNRQAKPGHKTERKHGFGKIPTPGSFARPAFLAPRRKSSQRAQETKGCKRENESKRNAQLGVTGLDPRRLRFWCCRGRVFLSSDSDVSSLRHGNSRRAKRRVGAWVLLKPESISMC